MRSAYVWRSGTLSCVLCAHFSFFIQNILVRCAGYKRKKTLRWLCHALKLHCVALIVAKLYGIRTVLNRMSPQIILNNIFSKYFYDHLDQKWSFCNWKILERLPCVGCAKGMVTTGGLLMWKWTLSTHSSADCLDSISLKKLYWGGGGGLIYCSRQPTSHNVQNKIKT
jgi:hypothetical protein